MESPHILVGARGEAFDLLEERVSSAIKLEEDRPRSWRPSASVREHRAGYGGTHSSLEVVDHLRRVLVKRSEIMKR